ncbi:endonuclease/exonuclease/phosphatase family protein [Sphingomonas sp. TREG-RG-20F-R18-01]|uniref:endonuclease/exonuclease/phosphatase family protein n=1 Tax=Sphingomonas sp. TREG-RG-20F-R18-01 TaxID=2914982 RepID=UPI001F59915B|nr:endonuclease/exonuclease/phosphatase family protein [Sphingomonas sp. TREG-RG-20F-R18-01]
MTTTYWNLGGGDLYQDWSNIGLITTNDDWSGVPSIMGYRGDGLTSGTGIDPRTLTGTSPVIDVNANQTNPNTFTTGGVTEFQIANPTIALSGSGTAAAPYLAMYLDATGRQGVTLSFTLRDLENGPDNAVQQVAVQYRLGDTGAWVNVPGGYVADATSGPNAFGADIPVSVTLPSDANNAATLQVRVMTTNAIGNDEWVGIDDIKVTSSAGTGNVPGVLSIGDASTIEGDAGSHMIDFTVSRIGGANGAVDATYSVLLPGGNGGASASDFGAVALTGTVHFADGQATAKISLPVLGDRAPEPNETFSITLSNPTNGATIDRATATGTILNDDILPLKIGQIQGEGHTSGFVGQTVLTEGVVTAVDSNGFYIQDLGDGNSRTSDAVFIFTGTAPEFFVGDAVSVQGVVTEYRAGTGGLTVTEITAPVVTLESWDNQLPDAVLIGQGGLTPPSTVIDDDNLKSYDPTTDGIDFWESLEGMRVTIDKPLVVSNTTNDQYAETDIVASHGVGATGVNDRGGITIANGDFNPEKIQIQGDSGIFAGFKAGYSIGDQLSSVTGIVNYAAAKYEVLVTEAVTVTKDVTLAKEVTTLTGDATHLSMATYNVENLDSSDGKFDVLAANVVYNLRAPDIIALQEIQDADGAGTGKDLSGVKTAQGLIDAIGAINGGHYAYVEIAPTTANSTGGEPNGNIRSGYLYNLDRVTYVEGSAALIDGAAYNNTRKPLVADFLFHGQTVTAIDVHLTSRGGSDPLWGATQPPADAGDAARTAQAAGVKDYVNAHLADNPNLNIAILGDWNGFSWENAQTQLTDPAKGGQFTDLNTLLSPEERYSYLFEGNAQQIDHILVSKSLLANAQYDAVHINSQFGDDRPTDHDPQLAVFDFSTVLARATVSSAQVDSGMHADSFDFSAAPVTTDPAQTFGWATADAAAAKVATSAPEALASDPATAEGFVFEHLHSISMFDTLHLA